MEEFYCPNTRVAVYQGNKAIPRRDLTTLTVDKLLEYNIRAQEKDIQLESDGENHIGFNFLGATFNKRFERRAPASELLDSLVNAAGYFDPKTQQFYF